MASNWFLEQCQKLLRTQAKKGIWQMQGVKTNSIQEIAFYLMSLFTYCEAWELNFSHGEKTAIDTE